MTGTLATPQHLRRSGALLVAAVYAMSGHALSWPLEPAHYDLLADPGCGGPILRVQVKTCTTQQGGSWVCWITRSEYAPVADGKRRTPYEAGVLDVLAIVDGDLCVYLIPFDLVVGMKMLMLRAYQAYRVADLTLAEPVLSGMPADE